MLSPLHGRTIDVAQQDEQLVEQRSENVEQEDNGIGDNVQVPFVHSRGGGGTTRTTAAVH